MIDWYSLLTSALWVSGIALLLAAVSWQIYAASLTGTSLRTRLAAPGFTLISALAMTMLMLGLALRPGSPLWMAVIWGLLALGFLYAAWIAFRAWRSTTVDG